MQISVVLYTNEDVSSRGYFLVLFLNVSKMFAKAVSGIPSCFTNVFLFAYCACYAMHNIWRGACEALTAWTILTGRFGPQR